MDSDTLNTASGYLNNLLLARGLLRNGKSLDFAKPTRETRAQVINLVHDLLLRRDRDQENREQVALTLRTLRTDEARKDGEIEKLRARVDEKERVLLQAQSETRNIKVEMKRLESSTRILQDQFARLKASVGHIKTQCANDVRKRDMHIERLKTHLQGQQRGNKGAVIAPMLNVSGGNSSFGRSCQPWTASVRDLQDPEYSLKQETNEFLTQLGQSLSDENDGLIAMLKGTLQTMKQLLGLDKEQEEDDIDGHDASMTAESESSPLSYEVLATELESTLEVLKAVLTSADFVSMEEVEARDDEIMRLREGWVHMEARWREVLVMMNTWRAKMKDGDTINLEDLKRGLGLGEGLNPAPPTVTEDTARQPIMQAQEEDYPVVNAPMNITRDSGIGHRVSPSPAHSQDKVNHASRGALEPPELFSHRKPTRERQLRRISPNVQSPRKVSFADDVAKSSPLLSKSELSETIPPRQTSMDAEATSGLDMEYRSAGMIPRSSPQREHTQLFFEPTVDVHDPASPIFGTDERHDQLTVEDKLRLAQLEAEQAASAMTLEDEQKGDSSQLELELDEEINRLRSPAKKTRIKGRPKRRKSTLSPEELDALLGFE